MRDLVAAERERRAWRCRRALRCRAVASRGCCRRRERVRERPVSDNAAAATRSASFVDVVLPTPDDGTRLTGILPWDEASRPAYPVRPDPAEQAAYGPAQLAVPRHLMEVHDHLRAELTQVRDVVEQVVRGHLAVGSARSAVNAMTMRQNNWTLGAYCESYCRVVTGHHGARGHRHLPPPAGAATPTRCRSSTGSRRSTR